MKRGAFAILLLSILSLAACAKAPAWRAVGARAESAVLKSDGVGMTSALVDLFARYNLPINAGDLPPTFHRQSESVASALGVRVKGRADPRVQVLVLAIAARAVAFEAMREHLEGDAAALALSSVADLHGAAAM